MVRTTLNWSGFAFFAAILTISCCFLGSQGLKFSSGKYVFLLTTGTSKGEIGKVRVQISTANIVYSCLEYTSLIQIDRVTGTVTLLKYLDEIAAAQYNNTQITIQAATNDKSEMANTKVVIIILPTNYGDNLAQRAIQNARVVVKSNHIFKSGKFSATANSLHRFLRKIYGDNPAKDISMAQTRMEKAIEITKTNIILQFKKLFGNNAVVYGLFHVQQLISPEMIQEMDNEAECRNPTIVDRASCSATTVFRTFDGTCNNLNRPNLGAADTAFVRILPALYFDPDGLNDPIGYPNQPNAPDVPSPFKVSRDFIKDEVASVSSSSSLNTHVIMQFGQFVDHDLDLAVDSEGSDECSNVRCDGSPSDFECPCFPILPLSNGQPPCIRVVRSAAVCQEKGYPKTREQINVNTGYVDASQIYGSTQTLADFLRLNFNKSNDEGLLRSSNGFDGELLPLDTSENVPVQLCEDLGGCFIAGDARSNEQQALASFHALFLREHNRIAKRLKIINNHWDGERVYQETRRIIGAVFQKITFHDYLPLILGPRSLPRYRGYNKNVNSGISNSFATAAYRYGHSQIRPEFEVLDENFDPIAPAINLRFMFFNNTFIQKKGIEPLLFGLIANFSEIVDRTLSSGIVRHLFERVGSPGQNLAALNIHRSRDHGLPGYNKFRKLCGLSDAKTFEDTSNEIKDPENRKILKQLYNDDPNLAELWVAGLAEKPVPGGSVGPTFKCVIADQFRRARDGDRFFFRSRNAQFLRNQFREIWKASLSRIYCDNLKSLVSIQKNAFKAPTTFQGRVECSRIKKMDLCVWKESKYFKRPCFYGIPTLNKKTKNCTCQCRWSWFGKRCERKLARRSRSWHATILFNGRVNCSGALVDKEHVLTTRSCISGLEYSRNSLWKVRLGDYRAMYKDFGEQTFQIKSVFYPPSTASGASDIALIRLNIPVIPAVPVYRYKTRVIRNKPIEISGINSLITRRTNWLSVWTRKRVHALSITLANQKVCKNVFTSFNQNNEICSLEASFPDVERHPFTFSGSPLVQYLGGKPQLIGLLTNIEEVKSPRELRFARYIKLSQFVPWLKNYLDNNSVFNDY